jgi:hypothetical protein
VSEPPLECIEEPEWPAIGPIFRERIASCGDPENPPTEAERARCDREDYLESECYGINAYRRKLTGEE